MDKPNSHTTDHNRRDHTDTFSKAGDASGLSAGMSHFDRHRPDCHDENPSGQNLIRNTVVVEPLRDGWPRPPDRPND